MEVAESFGSLPTLANLPPDRTALYELARLDPARLRAAIAAGHVTPRHQPQVAARYRVGKPNLTVVLRKDLRRDPRATTPSSLTRRGRTTTLPAGERRLTTTPS